LRIRQTIDRIERCKAVIFDLDGTLIDSVRVWLEADRAFAEENGRKYDPSLSERMKGMYFESACEFLIGALRLDITAREAGERIHELVSDAYINKVSPKPFAGEYISYLRKLGKPMCVATSNSRPLAEACLERLGMHAEMEFIITSDEVGCGKESGLIYLKAASMLGTKPSETAVFEDSPHGLKSASSEGFYTVGVISGDGLWEAADAESAADAVICSFEQLLPPP